MKYIESIFLSNTCKIVLLLLIIISFAVFISPRVVNAENIEDYQTITLRAGGGGGSSTGSSSSGSSSGHHTSGTRSYGTGGVISNILSAILMVILLCIGTIVLYFKVLRSSFNSKRYMRMLDDKDITWNYKNIERQVIDSYYTIQEAWAEGDMKNAKGYMTKELYENFQSKLEWMEVKKRKNVLEKIRLVNVKPVSVHDDSDDNKDLIWFYIKGKMVDYMINTETLERVGGSMKATSFVEFWKFTRTKDNRWVLSKILQQEEANKITFQ